MTAPPSAEGRAQEIRALLSLRILPGVADRTVWTLFRHFGSGRAALEADEDEFVRVVGVRGGRKAAAHRSDSSIHERVVEALNRTLDLGVAVTGLGLAGYPPALLQLHDPPPVLFLRGDRALLDVAGVAVVGSRRATAYGRRIAEIVGGALARAGTPVVSGLALGVDAASHRGAIHAGGRAVAVLGTGVDVPHPTSNAALFRTLARDHLLVSEFLPGQPALPHHFPRRNRILAALSEAVVVVEAAERSGALITVDHATDLGKDVLAVPGRVDSPTSRGTNALIRDGATIVDDPRAIAEILPSSLLSIVRARGRVDSEPRRSEAPRGVPGRVWEALAEGARGVDDLAGALDVSPARILAALSALELDGLAEPRPGMLYARSDGAMAASG